MHYILIILHTIYYILYTTYYILQSIYYILYTIHYTSTSEHADLACVLSAACTKWGSSGHTAGHCQCMTNQLSPLSRASLKLWRLICRLSLQSLPLASARAATVVVQLAFVYIYIYIDIYIYMYICLMLMVTSVKS